MRVILVRNALGLAGASSRNKELLQNAGAATFLRQENWKTDSASLGARKRWKNLSSQSLQLGFRYKNGARTRKGT